MRGLALKPVLLVALAKTALNLAFAGRYGWQRDELYYAVAGHHVQDGYVDFPPLTALLASFDRLLFGHSLYGLRVLAILAGAVVVVLAALIARELGGGRRAQVFAAVLVGFSPVLVATNGLFQPVSFDQLMTMAVLLFALRIALGRGSWVALGAAIGVGLETKYTLAVVVALLFVAFLVFRRDALEPRGVLTAAAVAFVLMIPNLLWQLDHNWASVRFFVNPPSSATDESRPAYIGNVILLTGLVSFPVAVAGVRMLIRDRALRPFGWMVVGVVLAYFVLGGKSYYALPVMLFALSVGALPLDGWATARRLRIAGTAFVLLLVVLLPLGLPVLPVRTAEKWHLMDARSDYADELGWPQLARTVEGASRGADVVLAENYGEAGALFIFGRGLPPVASGHVTMRYWRPRLSGRRAVVVNFTRAEASFCGADYRVVARVRMPVDNEEADAPVARCTLRGSLAQVWPQVLRHY
ncbi:MAG TPA: glycosyltransferase family 39 protein [Thermoleophilaceae bacterium]